ncbi:hypothetical protein EOM09_08860 [bacterium]|nr:hypothetical protein [bacterium]
MSPEEKAKQLITKHDSVIHALITVKEVIEQWEYIDIYLADGRLGLNPNLKYWYKVKASLLKILCR